MLMMEHSLKNVDIFEYWMVTDIIHQWVEHLRLNKITLFWGLWVTIHVHIFEIKTTKRIYKGDR